MGKPLQQEWSLSSITLQKFAIFHIHWAEELKDFVRKFYGKIDINAKDCDSIMDLMVFDKKNVSGVINFVLLEAMENCKIDQQISSELIREGLLYFSE